MPRNKQGGSLASYFYDAAGDGSGAPPRSVQSVSTNARAAPATMATTPAFLDKWVNGVWTGKGPAPASGPPKAGKKRRTRSKKTKPIGAAREMSEGMKRHQAKVDKESKVKSMKTHFAETERLLERNEKWPMHYTHSRITFYINLCKDEIKKARSHIGPGSHKLNLEAVHKKHLHETDGWSFKQIYTDISQYTASEHIKNHLTLEKPMIADGESGFYVNVALAWLFAAKRQLMTTLAKFIQDQPRGERSADMNKFLEENEKGVNSRRAYRQDKELLGQKHHAHPYDLHDKAVLARQHAMLYD